MLNKIRSNAEERMGKSVQAFQDELTKLRTGRAHPSLLEHIKVDYYDTPTPLNQVANVTVEDARTLMVTPWEKPMIAKIEKAILTSDLGLNPNTAGTIIRVPLPPLTEERRKSLAKVVRDEAEKARVSVRNIRREANQDFKDLQKAKDITEDDQRRAETDMQQLTDKYIANIDKLSQEKEKDLMSV